MTLTVKLDSSTEQDLRLQAAASGRTTSEIMREALLQWLALAPAPNAGSYACGVDLFGKHAGPANLATNRKAALAQDWASKHAALAPSAPHAKRHAKKA
jgi:plasmid stability protein